MYKKATLKAIYDDMYGVEMALSTARFSMTQSHFSTYLNRHVPTEFLTFPQPTMHHLPVMNLRGRFVMGGAFFIIFILMFFDLFLSSG